MNHRFPAFRRYRFFYLSAVFLLILLSLFKPQSVVQAAVPSRNVSGKVYASTLSDNTALKLIGNTTLVMDTSRTLDSISGNVHSLNVQSGKKGAVLTVTSESTKNAIYVRTFRTNASIRISPKKKKSYGILAVSHIHLEGGCQVFVSNESYGIYSKSGSIYSAGYVISTAETRGLYGAESVQITNGTVNASNSEKKNGAIHAGDDITISGGDVQVVGYWGLYSQNRNINITGGTVRVDTGGTGVAIYAERGKVRINGTVSTKGYHGIQAKTLIQIQEKGNLKTAQGTKHGIHSGGSVEIYGKVNAKGTKSDGIYAVGDIIVYGGNLNAYGKTNAIYTKNGKIQF